jgi:catechol 2,3-dioxygenase-like lactoylglutathione lyase family enzyme
MVSLLNEERTLRKLILTISLIVMGSATNSWAQLYTPNTVGAAMGHLHYNVKDMQASRKFWIDLGAQPVMLGEREVLKFPGVMVLLSEADSSGGTEGSVVDHVGFRVPNVLQSLERLKQLGYKVAVNNSGTGKTGSVYNPENERIELMEDMSINVKFAPDAGPYVEPSKMTVPITLHHIHFFVPENDVAEIKSWYVKFFGAVPGKRYKTVEPPYEAADLPGVNLNISGTTEQLSPLKGRRLDHIGFEIDNLEAFCKKLEAMGITFDRPYKVLPNGLATAFFTDPWGVYIELTEGLDRL